ncbi:uncharacterized protein LOC141911330 [Tubulanus polymorphus]|uniref:uncharacterized protein LOC141911330 n=1 Tax=Tubulanus polymorphus TaxID=672921 RepID=UPI003DA34045
MSTKGASVLRVAALVALVGLEISVVNCTGVLIAFECEASDKANALHTTLGHEACFQGYPMIFDANEETEGYMSASRYQGIFDKICTSQSVAFKLVGNSNSFNFVKRMCIKGRKCADPGVTALRDNAITTFKTAMKSHAYAGTTIAGNLQTSAVTAHYCCDNKNHCNYAVQIKPSYVNMLMMVVFIVFTVSLF